MHVVASPTVIVASLSRQADDSLWVSFHLHAPVCCRTVDIPTALAELRSAFPSTAVFQGIHFKFAVRNNILLLEIKRGDRFFYWLVSDEAKLINASLKSRLAPMKTIGESFPNLSQADFSAASLGVPDMGRHEVPTVRSPGAVQASAPSP